VTFTGLEARHDEQWHNDKAQDTQRDHDDDDDWQPDHAHVYVWICRQKQLTNDT